MGCHWSGPSTGLGHRFPLGSLFLSLALSHFPSSSLFPFNQAIAHGTLHQAPTSLSSPSLTSTASISLPLDRGCTPAHHLALPLPNNMSRPPLFPSRPRSPHSTHVQILRPSNCPPPVPSGLAPSVVWVQPPKQESLTFQPFSIPPIALSPCGPFLPTLSSQTRPLIPHWLHRSQPFP